MSKQLTANVLRVTAQADGYHHSGLRFSAHAVDVPLSLLSVSQRQHLKNDPMLHSEEVDTQAELQPLHEQAAIGHAVTALLPPDWTGSAVDYVTHLQTELASHAAATGPKAAAHAAVKHEAPVHGAKTAVKAHGK